MLDIKNNTEIAERLVKATLKHVPFDGWTEAAVHLGLQDLGLEHSTFKEVFDGSISNVVEHYSHMLDDHMIGKLQEINLEEMKIRERIHTGVMTRIRLLSANRLAAKKTCSYLLLPQHAALGSKLLYRTVNKIWYAAGDRATDFNFYTKRVLLAGVYSSTLLYWFNDESPDFENTQAFLSRRIENVMLIPKVKAKIKKCWPWSK